MVKDVLSGHACGIRKYGRQLWKDYGNKLEIKFFRSDFQNIQILLKLTF
jgi:hypothetical protein